MLFFDIPRVVQSMRWFGSRRFAGSSRMKGGVCSFVAFVLAVFMLLTGVLVGLPVVEAAADGDAIAGTVKAGVADGYFSTLDKYPMRSESATADGARKVLFGRAGSLANAAKVVEPGDADKVQVDGKYLVLGKGLNDNQLDRAPGGAYVNPNGWRWSKTTSLKADEVLLWADDVVKSGFDFAAEKLCGNGSVPCNTFDSGTAVEGVASYESNVAAVSRELDSNT